MTDLREYANKTAAAAGLLCDNGIIESAIRTIREETIEEIAQLGRRFRVKQIRECANCRMSMMFIVQGDEEFIADIRALSEKEPK